MVIVKLSGGLGNQMFQYAAARRLAYVNEASLKLDVSWFDNIPRGDTTRQYELFVFSCVQEIALPKEIKALRGVDIERWPKIAKRLLKNTGLFMKQSCVREKHFHFDPEILRIHGDVYLDGYWQSDKYFADIEDVIRAEFIINSVPDPVSRELGDIIKSCESVSVHVRRGDYVANSTISQFHGVSSLNYYKTSIAELAGKLRNPHFFVFSDDPAWLKSKLKVNVPITYIEHNSPEKAYEDLRLMSLCKHHIITNSSFSWWGAWLSSNPEKAVIAPQKWFARDDINTDDLMPNSWLRI
jgi:hypothetical protein